MTWKRHDMKVFCSPRRTCIFVGTYDSWIWCIWWKKGTASFFWSRSIKMFLVYAPQDPFRLVGFWMDFPLQFKDKRIPRFSRLAAWRLEGKKFTKRNTTLISFGNSTKQCAFSIGKVLIAFKELTGRTFFLLIWMLYMSTEFG